jgi:hypothetical protein
MLSHLKLGDLRDSLGVVGEILYWSGYAETIL